MDLSSNLADSLQISFSNYLKNKRLRNTAERNAISLTVCRTKEPFSFDMIWQQLEDNNFHVSRASVYNTMELMLDANIVVRHNFSGTLAQYELKHIAKQYNHVICTHCGTVRRVKNEKLNNLFSDYKIPKFTLEHYSLHFYGICSKCKYRKSQNEAKIKNKRERQ